MRPSPAGPTLCTRQALNRADRGSEGAHFRTRLPPTAQSAIQVSIRTGGDKGRDVGQQPCRRGTQLQPITAGFDPVRQHAPNPTDAGSRLSEPSDAPRLGKSATPDSRCGDPFIVSGQHAHCSPQQERSSRYMPHLRYSSSVSAGSPNDVAIALATTANRCRYLKIKQKT